MRIKTGFSLVELSIVLILSMLVISFSVFYIPASDALIIRFELERLHAHILYMQRRAQVEHKQYKIKFNMVTHSYTDETQEHILNNRICFGILDDALGPPSSPHKQLWKAITFVDNTLYCYPDGTVSAGIVYFTDKRKSCLYALSCAVAPHSHVTCYKFNIYTRSWQRFF